MKIRSILHMKMIILNIHYVILKTLYTNVEILLDHLRFFFSNYRLQFLKRNSPSFLMEVVIYDHVLIMGTIILLFF